MSNFPTHTHDYNGTPVVVPISVLDCDQPVCQSKARVANAGTHFEMGYIEAMIATEQDSVKQHMETVALWHLVREAKRRMEKPE